MTTKDLLQSSAAEDAELDDLLDDVLDDLSKAVPKPSLSSTTISNTNPNPNANTSASQPHQTETDEQDVSFSEEFASELAAGMEELMKEMESSPELKNVMERIMGGFELRDLEETEGNGSGKGEDQDEDEDGIGIGSGVDEDAMMKAFAAAMKAGAGGNGNGSGSANGGLNPEMTKNQTTEKNEGERSSNEAGSFQDKINETLNKLKNSSDQVEAELGDPNSMEALMEQMFSQMDGLADSDEFQNVLEGMMQQLMSREILYEPLKDLAVKYPEYLSNNKSSIPEEDYKRYTEQHGIVQQIVTIYNSTSGREETEAESKQVVDLLQKMQDCGQPPPELLKSLAPDMEIDPKTGLPAIPGVPTDGECSVM